MDYLCWLLTKVVTFRSDPSEPQVGERSDKALDLLETEPVLRGSKLAEPLWHAVRAAQVAAVSDR